ncbi:c-type cytochrome [Roseibium aquae]|nr:cytochrome c [Roseibium aquae]
MLTRASQWPAICLTAIAMLVPVQPLRAADADNGKQLSLQWCASCHLVSNDQQVGTSDSQPTFYDLAADRSWDEASLKTFLADPHPKMPDMALTPRETADIARYIDSLQP